MLSRLGLGAAFLLESAGALRSFSRWTLLGSHPIARFTSRGGLNRFHWMSRGQKWSWKEEPPAALRRVMAAFPAPEPDAETPFAGGAVGMFSYELGRRLLPLSPRAEDDLGLFDLSFYFFDRFLLFDRARGRAWAIAYARGESALEARREARLRAEVLTGAVQGSDARSRGFRLAEAGSDPLPIRASLPADAYRCAVGRCIEQILEGEAYELCLTGRFETEYAGDPLGLYRVLRRDNPAPFAALLRFPEATLVAASPERFLKLSGDGLAEARPIKGTRPRGPSPAADAALRAELEASEKDRAENTMIVDLLRNDLSRVCEPGSVSVPELCVVEDYATVFQMVSTITGRMAPDRDRFDLLASAFPGGSMTGAPKIAAMRILERLEPVVRGYYSGAFGYLGFDGRADLSMTIRSVQLLGRRALVGAGGAVLAASDPDEEWKEALVKLRGPMEALARAQGMCYEEPGT